MATAGITDGVVLVAYGANARGEAAQAVQSLERTNTLPVVVVGEKPVEGAGFIPFEQRDAGGRWAKLNADLLSPWDQTLYLDADTRVQGDVSAGFQALADGYDLAICPSMRQGRDVMGHASQCDREATFHDLDCGEVLGLQAGVFWFRRNERITALFQAWREEWERFRFMDQPALLRALHRAPVRLWLFGNEYNGGELVKHLFGRAR